MPQPLLRALELPLQRRVAHTIPGEYLAPQIGAGIELARLRPYHSGDDVRHLDAAATARSGQPHVRLHVPERTLTTWILLDVSASMAFGTARRLKADVAEGVVLALARIAVARSGGVALARFGAGRLAVTPPGSSRRALTAIQAALGEGIAGDATGGGGRVGDRHELAHALERLGELASQPGLVAVVSDMRDQRDWEGPLGALRLRHSVLVIEIEDPRERELPAVGLLAVVNPETGERVEVDTTDRRVRERFAELERSRREEIARECVRLRANHIALSTEEDWLRELGRRLR